MAVLSVPGYSGHTSGPIGTVTRIVLHATVSPCVRGGALQVAAYFKRPNAGGLAHYVVDPSQVVQCAPETVSTWGAPPNTGSIHVELCDPQTGDPARWADADHAAMLSLASPLVRDIAARHDLPLEFVDAAGLRAGRRGITTHAEVSKAWRQTDHTDPGRDFPLSAFIAGLSATTPAAPPEDDMFNDTDRAALARIDQRTQNVQDAVAKFPALVASHTGPVDPQAIANEVADALGPDLAAQVLAALSAKLA